MCVEKCGSDGNDLILQIGLSIELISFLFHFHMNSCYVNRSIYIISMKGFVS